MDRTAGVQQQPVEPAVRFREDNPVNLARARELTGITTGYLPAQRSRS